MAETVIGLGEIGHHLPDGEWILVFGGVTREGNRRARRAVRRVLESNRFVIWFDGFSESLDDKVDGRVAIDVPVPEGRVVVVDYAEEERRFWLNRMADGVPVVVVRQPKRTENGLPGSATSQPLMARLWNRLVGFGNLLRRKIMRRISLAFRGVVGWRIIKADVLHLHVNVPAPTHIIYGDDPALTLGWRAARLWPEAKTSMEVQES